MRSIVENSLPVQFTPSSSTPCFDQPLWRFFAVGNTIFASSSNSSSSINARASASGASASRPSETSLPPKVFAVRVAQRATDENTTNLPLGISSRCAPNPHSSISTTSPSSSSGCSDDIAAFSVLRQHQIPTEDDPSADGQRQSANGLTSKNTNTTFSQSEAKGGVSSSASLSFRVSVFVIWTNARYSLFEDLYFEPMPLPSASSDCPRVRDASSTIASSLSEPHATDSAVLLRRERNVVRNEDMRRFVPVTPMAVLFRPFLSSESQSTQGTTVQRGIPIFGTEENSRHVSSSSSAQTKSAPPKPPVGTCPGTQQACCSSVRLPRGVFCVSVAFHVGVIDYFEILDFSTQNSEGVVPHHLCTNNDATAAGALLCSTPPLYKVHYHGIFPVVLAYQEGGVSLGTNQGIAGYTQSIPTVPSVPPLADPPAPHSHHEGEKNRNRSTHLGGGQTTPFYSTGAQRDESIISGGGPILNMLQGSNATTLLKPIFKLAKPPQPQQQQRSTEPAFNEAVDKSIPSTRFQEFWKSAVTPLSFFGRSQGAILSLAWIPPPPNVECIGPSLCRRGRKQQLQQTTTTTATTTANKKLLSAGEDLVEIWNCNGNHAVLAILHHMSPIPGASMGFSSGGNNDTSRTRTFLSTGAFLLPTKGSPAYWANAPTSIRLETKRRSNVALGGASHRSMTSAPTAAVEPFIGGALVVDGPWSVADVQLQGVERPTLCMFSSRTSFGDGTSASKSKGRLSPTPSQAERKGEKLVDGPTTTTAFIGLFHSEMRNITSSSNSNNHLHGGCRPTATDKILSNLIFAVYDQQGVRSMWTVEPPKAATRVLDTKTGLLVSEQPRMSLLQWVASGNGAIEEISLESTGSSSLGGVVARPPSSSGLRAHAAATLASARSSSKTIGSVSAVCCVYFPSGAVSFLIIDLTISLGQLPAAASSPSSSVGGSSYSPLTLNLPLTNGGGNTGGLQQHYATSTFVEIELVSSMLLDLPAATDRNSFPRLSSPSFVDGGETFIFSRFSTAGDRRVKAAEEAPSYRGGNAAYSVVTADDKRLAFWRIDGREIKAKAPENVAQSSGVSPSAVVHHEADVPLDQLYSTRGILLNSQPELHCLYSESVSTTCDQHPFSFCIPHMVAKEDTEKRTTTLFSVNSTLTAWTATSSSEWDGKCEERRPATGRVMERTCRPDGDPKVRAYLATQELRRKIATSYAESDTAQQDSFGPCASSSCSPSLHSIIQGENLFLWDYRPLPFSANSSRVAMVAASTSYLHNLNDVFLLPVLVVQRDLSLRGIVAVVTGPTTSVAPPPPPPSIVVVVSSPLTHDVFFPSLFDVGCSKEAGACINSSLPSRDVWEWQPIQLQFLSRVRKLSGGPADSDEFIFLLILQELCLGNVLAVVISLGIERALVPGAVEIESPSANVIDPKLSFTLRVCDALRLNTSSSCYTTMPLTAFMPQQQTRENEGDLRSQSESAITLRFIGEFERLGTILWYLLEGDTPSTAAAFFASTSIFCTNDPISSNIDVKFAARTPKQLLDVLSLVKSVKPNTATWLDQSTSLGFSFVSDCMRLKEARKNDGRKETEFDDSALSQLLQQVASQQHGPPSLLSLLQHSSVTSSTSQFLPEILLPTTSPSDLVRTVSAFFEDHRISAPPFYWSPDAWQNFFAQLFVSPPVALARFQLSNRSTLFLFSLLSGMSLLLHQRENSTMDVSFLPNLSCLVLFHQRDHSTQQVDIAKIDDSKRETPHNPQQHDPFFKTMQFLQFHWSTSTVCSRWCRILSCSSREPKQTGGAAQPEKKKDKEASVPYAPKTHKKQESEVEEGNDIVVMMLTNTDHIVLLPLKVDGHGPTESFSGKSAQSLSNDNEPPPPPLPDQAVHDLLNPRTPMDDSGSSGGICISPMFSSWVDFSRVRVTPLTPENQGCGSMIESVYWDRIHRTFRVTLTQGRMNIPLE